MFKQFFAVLTVVSVLFFLVGCTKQRDVSVSDESTVETNTVSPVEPSESNILSESNTGIEETGNQKAPDSDVTSLSTSEKSTSVTTPETTESKKQTDSDKKAEQIVHASSVMLSFCSYESNNEQTPFILGSPVYKILYSGKRIQTGDSFVLSVGVSPVNHTDRISIDVSNGLEYSLSGNSLHITVKQDGNYGVGRVSVYAIAENGSIAASAEYSFVVDPAGDPFTDTATVLADYIRAKGMRFTSFSEGYTTSDPTKSITHYAGAPAWDDMIDKSNSAWLKQCFNLIDQYKSTGFSKVNFIITDISVGFSAAI